MRRILIDSARQKRRPKHGGDRQRVDLDDAISIAEPKDDLLALDEAPSRLAAQEPMKAELASVDDPRRFRVDTCCRKRNPDDPSRPGCHAVHDHG